MRKGDIRKALYKQGVHKFKLLGAKKKLINCPKKLIEMSPNEEGILYKIPNKEEYWICLSSSKYNTQMQKVEVL